jgi:uncharacterized SAM-binding protein YcdF (DUF218 family)
MAEKKPMAPMIPTLAEVFWSILAPDRLLLIAFSTGSVLLFSRYKRIGRQVILGTSTIFFLIACLPLGAWLLWPLENRFPTQLAVPDTIDGIIVLSGAENRELTNWRNQPILSENAERLVGFVGLALRHPEARLVVSDGPSVQVSGATLGATTARKLFEELSLPIERIDFEERAQNTYENASYSQLLVEPKVGETWVLVTSAFHMPRAVGVWRELGWEVIPYPVDYRVNPESISIGMEPAGSLRSLSMGLREWGSLLLYRFMGRTAAIFPKPRRE